MADSSGTKIQRQKVREQLQRILESPLFRNSAKQSHFLNNVVESWLSGTDISEKDIAEEVFPPYDPLSHKVRQAAVVIRQKLRTYYDTIGKNDFVELELLPGPSYKLRVSTHEESKAATLYRRAMECKEFGSIRSLYTAMRWFRLAVQHEPEFAEAAMEFAETSAIFEIMMAIFYADIKFINSLNLPLQKDNRDEVVGVCKQLPDHWLARALLGFYRLLEQDLKGAEEEIHCALKLDAKSLSTSLWYAAYLMTIGRTAEALHIAELRSMEESKQGPRRWVYVFFLYTSRKYTMALNELYFEEGPRPPEHGLDLVNMLFSLLYYSTGQHRDCLQSLSEIGDIEARIWSLFCERRKYKGVKPRLLAGLRILALTASGNCEAATEEFSILRHCYPAGYLQIAIGYMAMGNHTRAIAALRIALRRYDALANWAPMLPLFDPLREHPFFPLITRPIRRPREDS